MRKLAAHRALRFQFILHCFAIYQLLRYHRPAYLFALSSYKRAFSEELGKSAVISLMDQRVVNHSTAASFSALEA